MVRLRELQETQQALEAEVARLHAVEQQLRGGTAQPVSLAVQEEEVSV